MTGPDVVAFVTARLDEWEAKAQTTVENWSANRERHAADVLYLEVRGDAEPVDQLFAIAEQVALNAAHVLREVAAMRAIVDAATAARRITPEWFALQSAVARLAAIWSVHADHRAEWTP